MLTRRSTKYAVLIGGAASLAGITAPLAFAAPSESALPLCGSLGPDGQTVLGTYSVATGDSTTLSLNRRQKNKIEVRINVDGCRLPVTADHPYRLPIAILVHDFKNDGGDDIEPGEVADQLVAYTLRSGVTSASLYLRVDNRKGLEPGTYRGNVDFDSDEKFGRALSVPMSITVQYSEAWRVALFCGLPAVLVGIFILWAKSVASDPPPRQKPWRWVWSISNVLVIGAGVGSAFGVWLKEYLNDGTWGSSGVLQDGWILFGLMVGAFTALSAGLSAGVDAAHAQGAKAALAQRDAAPE